MRGRLAGVPDVTVLFCRNSDAIFMATLRYQRKSCILVRRGDKSPR